MQSCAQYIGLFPGEGTAMPNILFVHMAGVTWNTASLESPCHNTCAASWIYVTQLISSTLHRYLFVKSKDQVTAELYDSAVLRLASSPVVLPLLPTGNGGQAKQKKGMNWRSSTAHAEPNAQPLDSIDTLDPITCIRAKKLQGKNGRNLFVQPHRRLKQQTLENPVSKAGMDI